MTNEGVVDGAEPFNNVKKVLDHGYIRLVTAWGSDQAIVEAARMSTGKGFLGWGTRMTCTYCGTTGRISDQDEIYDCPKCQTGDEKLLKYLMENNHATPFEMAGMVVEVLAPIAVYREWHRHRTQSYNEQSARYGPLPAIDYVPSVARIMLGGGHLTKQAGAIPGAAVLTRDIAEEWRVRLMANFDAAEELYQWALQAGIPKELARGSLSVFRYSKMRAHANIRNWLAFLTLRQDQKAQYEIRQYAHVIGELIEENFPITYSLYKDKRGW